MSNTSHDYVTADGRDTAIKQLMLTLKKAIEFDEKWVKVNQLLCCSRILAAIQVHLQQSDILLAPRT